MAQTVKNPPAIQEMRVQSLGLEDSLGKALATRSSILAWRIPWTERSLAGYIPRGHKESDTTGQLCTYVRVGSLSILFRILKKESIHVDVWQNQYSIVK